VPAPGWAPEEQAMRQERLCVLAPDGRIDQYRTCTGRVEFRRLKTAQHDGAASPWRPLTMEELAIHLNLQTLVGDWLLTQFSREIESRDGGRKHIAARPSSHSLDAKKRKKPRRA
jgi:hypothetical protein